MKLLTREEFKRQVFAKTNGKCCVPGCHCDAVDAHHIMDRKLWTDGGYYIENGAALCSRHHIMAEDGDITPEQCYKYMDTENWLKPDKLTCLTDEEFKYCVKHCIIDKWGK